MNTAKLGLTLSMRSKIEMEQYINSAEHDLLIQSAIAGSINAQDILGDLFCSGVYECNFYSLSEEEI